MGLRELFDRWTGRVKDDYRTAGLAMSGSHVGYSNARLGDAAEQQWRRLDEKAVRDAINQRVAAGSALSDGRDQAHSRGRHMGI
jgi:hypothetical protein